MAFRDIFKISRKTFFDPLAWFGYDTVRAQTLDTWSILKNLFSKPKSGEAETFEQAVLRLNLSETEITNTATTYRLYALMFAVFGILIFYYSFYLLFKHWVFTGWLLGVAASGLCFAQAFRYDFWSLQMRRRKLGLSFNDWLSSLIGGKEKTK